MPLQPLTSCVICRTPLRPSELDDNRTICRDCATTVRRDWTDWPDHAVEDELRAIELDEIGGR